MPPRLRPLIKVDKNNSIVFPILHKYGHDCNRTVYSHINHNCIYRPQGAIYAAIRFVSLKYYVGKSRNLFCVLCLVGILDNVLDSALVDVAGGFPLDVLTGDTVSHGVAAVELLLEDLAELRCADGHGDLLAAVDGSLHGAVDSVNAVVSGCAELVQGLDTVLIHVLVDELLCLTFGSLGVEVRQHGDLLGDLVDIEALNVVDTVEAVAAVVNGVGSQDALSLGHEQGSGGVVDGHEDEAVFLQSVDLGGEIRGVGVGEAGLDYLYGAIEVSFELIVDTLGVSIVGLEESADGLILVVGVDELSGDLTLVAVCEAHLVAVLVGGNVVTGCGGSEEEHVVVSGQVLELQAGLGGDGAQRNLHAALMERGVVAGNHGSVVLVVQSLQLEHDTVQTAGCVDLVNGHLGSIGNGLTVLGGIAGERAGETNDVLFVVLGVVNVCLVARSEGCNGTEAEHECQNERKYFRKFHD